MPLHNLERAAHKCGADTYEGWALNAEGALIHHHGGRCPRYAFDSYCYYHQKVHDRVMEASLPHLYPPLPWPNNGFTVTDKAA